MKKFAVFGNPIAHSKSPEIHQAFAKQCGISLSYEKKLVEVGQFNQFAECFFTNGGSGANVTVPFKEDALRFADKLTDRAKLSGAVNTLAQKDSVIVGDNTDGIGLVTDIVTNHQQSLTDKKILIIGAGGAAKGVIVPLAEQCPKSITIVNRTVEKADNLAKHFTDYIDSRIAIGACGFSELDNDTDTKRGNKTFDVIINATSVALSGQTLNLPSDIFTDKVFAYDMMYGAKPTAFLQFAQNNGATVTDGLGMLVEQAAKSFEIWHGVKPDTDSVIKAIRYQMIN